jgi:amicyanin
MRPAPRRLAPLLAAIGALALAASLASTTRAANASVQIVDMAFAPADVTVSVGDTVTWTNADPMIHTVTSTTGAFDSGDLDQGESYSLTFTEAGTFAYLCTPHPFMTGTVTVVAAGVAPGPSASAEIPNVAVPAPSAGGPAVPLAAAGLVLLAVAAGLGFRARRLAELLDDERRTERLD